MIQPSRQHALHARQRELADFILQSHLRYGRCTMDDICNHFDVSRAAAEYTVGHLQQKQYVYRLREKVRLLKKLPRWW